MTTPLESRLERAGQTLDQASAQYLTRQEAATEPTTRLTARPAAEQVGQRPVGPSRSHGIVSLVAALLVVGAVGVGVWAYRDNSQSLTAASGVTSPGQANPVANPLAEAVAKTRDAAAMSVGILLTAEAPTGPSRELVESWNYGSPDRWEQMSPTDPASPLGETPPAGTSVRLYVGDETWTVNDGRWVSEPDGAAPTPAPVALLAKLEKLGCHVEIDGKLVAWESGAAACEAPTPTGTPKLPVGTSVWTIDVDRHGRIARVDAGTVLNLGPDTDLKQSTRNRYGASAEATTLFWYDHVPEVSDRPED